MLYKYSPFIGTLLSLLFSIASGEILFNGIDYSTQSGTQASGTTVGYFDNNDYLTYTSANFGPLGNTKGLLINYAKGNDNGKLEIRLGSGTTGQLIAEFSPAKTNGWGTYITAYVDIADIDGVHDITLVAKDVHGVMNLAWFELSDFSDTRGDVYSRIPATEYSNQSGTRFESNGNVAYFDHGDSITYTHLNFGPAGTTKSIDLSYAKGNHSSGKVEVRLGGIDGTKIGEFQPSHTGGWGNYVSGNILINDVDGIHDLTFVGIGSSGVFNMQWFELT